MLTRFDGAAGAARSLRTSRRQRMSVSEEQRSRRGCIARMLEAHRHRMYVKRNSSESGKDENGRVLGFDTQGFLHSSRE
jgi:hypothetical protein